VDLGGPKTFRMRIRNNACNNVLTAVKERELSYHNGGGVHPIFVSIPEADAEQLEDVEGGEDLLDKEERDPVHRDPDLVATVEKGAAPPLLLSEALAVGVQLPRGDVAVQALALEEGALLLVPDVLVLLHVEVPVPAHRLKTKSTNVLRKVEANASASCRRKVPKLSRSRRDQKVISSRT
jgi:hypothetical protein